jgi:hypothetical protein
MLLAKERDWQAVVRAESIDPSPVDRASVPETWFVK